MNKKISKAQGTAGKATRLERDTMGELAVPADAYYGVQTARAIENFPISALRIPRSMLRALGLLKAAAARVNAELGFLDAKIAAAIQAAAQEVADVIDRHARARLLRVHGAGPAAARNAGAREARGETL